MDTKCLLGLYSCQETSAKLNDHHKQEMTYWDFIIVLEDVHIFVLYCSKTLSHSCLDISLLYKDIQYPISWPPLDH